MEADRASMAAGEVPVVSSGRLTTKHNSRVLRQFLDATECNAVLRHAASTTQDPLRPEEGVADHVPRAAVVADSTPTGTVPSFVAARVPSFVAARGLVSSASGQLVRNHGVAASFSDGVAVSTRTQVEVVALTEEEDLSLEEVEPVRDILGSQLRPASGA